MFDIATLKGMKLSELQDIAKLSAKIKVAGIKKDDLIQMIIKHQEETSKETTQAAPKPKRERIAKPVKNKTTDLFSEEPITAETQSQPVAETQEQPQENKQPKAKKKRIN